MLKNIREFENLHILLWLLKDVCWILNFKIPGTFMIVPTMAAAVFITWRWRHDSSEFFHSLAVCFWICANSIWMIGEFYYDDTLRPIAAPFFGLGLLSVGVHYLYLAPRRAIASRKAFPKE